MFSKRWKNLGGKNQLTRLLEQKRREGREIIDLTESNPTRVGLEYPKAEILEGLSDARSLSYEPVPLGLGEAREAVAAYYAARGCRVSPEDVALTCSTSEAYAFLFKLLMNPGESALVPQPSYPLFDFLGRAESVCLRHYWLHYGHRWQVDLEGLQAAVRPRVRAILAVHPNNPTGSLISPDEWNFVQSLARRRRLAVICDEVFSDYLWDAPAGANPLEETDTLTFVLNGLSKIAALPQLKLGWIVLRGPKRIKQAALRRLELLADTFLSVSTPVQVAAARLLGARKVIQPQIQKRTMGNLRHLRSALRGSAADVLEADGGWYAVVRLPRTRSEEQWALSLLENQDVLAHPGYLFGFDREAFLVVSLLPQTRLFRKGVSAILEELKPESR